MDIEKYFLKTFIKRFDNTPFLIKFWDGDEYKVGDEDPQFKIHFNKPIKKKEFLASTSLAFTEGFIDGSIEIEGDLYEALNMLLKNINEFYTDHKALPNIFHKITNKSKQKEEVSSHYDLGNNFYSLWLDKTLSYSCAYFKEPDDSLCEAQMNKIHHVLRKLNLKENQMLLDIGCGWGTLLIEAVKKYKVKGLGITLSEEQHKKFKERIIEEGLQDYLDVKIMDYRDLEKSGLSFDRVVSVGMLEHVGRPNYDLYFKSVDKVLKKEGVFLLHYISGLKESEGDAFIKKYIFPGGVIPSLREIISISAEYNYHTIDVESLRLHYKKTLLEWYKNFINNYDEINLMFGVKFMRMWSLYLCSCAASFNNGVVDLHQILFVKGINNKLPLTRQYLYNDENNI